MSIIGVVLMAEEGLLSGSFRLIAASRRTSDPIQSAFDCGQRRRPVTCWPARPLADPSGLGLRGAPFTERLGVDDHHS
jgi:hypothetical protein